MPHRHQRPIWTGLVVCSDLWHDLSADAGGSDGRGGVPASCILQVQGLEFVCSPPCATCHGIVLQVLLAVDNTLSGGYVHFFTIPLPPLNRVLAALPQVVVCCGLKV